MTNNWRVNHLIKTVAWTSWFCKLKPDSAKVGENRKLKPPGKKLDVYNIGFYG